MYGLQNLGRSTSKIVSLSKQQCRTYICTKPRVRISLGEKFTHGLVMTGVPLLFPFYISTKFSEWSTANKE